MKLINSGDQGLSSENKIFERKNFQEKEFLKMFNQETIFHQNKKMLHQNFKFKKNDILNLIKTKYVVTEVSLSVIVIQ